MSATNDAPPAAEIFRTWCPRPDQINLVSPQQDWILVRHWNKEPYRIGSVGPPTFEEKALALRLFVNSSDPSGQTLCRRYAWEPRSRTLFMSHSFTRPVEAVEVPV